MDINDYSSCWYCDNIVDHPEQIGLLHLDFPRCFVLVPNSYEFNMNSYEDFKNEHCQINWLDPSEEVSEKTKDEVLDRLWHFMVTQEDEEESLSYDRQIDDSLESDLTWKRNKLAVKTTVGAERVQAVTKEATRPLYLCV